MKNLHAKILSMIAIGLALGMECNCRKANGVRNSILFLVNGNAIINNKIYTQEQWKRFVADSIPRRESASFPYDLFVSDDANSEFLYRLLIILGDSGLNTPRFHLNDKDEDSSCYFIGTDDSLFSEFFKLTSETRSKLLLGKADYSEFDDCVVYVHRMTKQKETVNLSRETTASIDKSRKKSIDILMVEPDVAAKALIKSTGKIERTRGAAPLFILRGSEKSFIE